MHKLDRTSASCPTCVDHYSYLTNSWDGLTAVDKQQIRASLQQMQGDRCAYCEGQIRHGGHIEHFRRKNFKHFPQETFAWDNLFLSCDSQDHCGHYKDRRNAPSYNPDDLIKPDVDDPEIFLYFYASGEVRPRAGVGVPDPHRAEETIRVFNLNCCRLQWQRISRLLFCYPAFSSMKHRLGRKEAYCFFLGAAAANIWRCCDRVCRETTTTWPVGAGQRGARMRGTPRAKPTALGHGAGGERGALA